MGIWWPCGPLKLTTFVDRAPESLNWKVICPGNLMLIWLLCLSLFKCHEKLFLHNSLSDWHLHCICSGYNKMNCILGIPRFGQELGIVAILYRLIFPKRFFTTVVFLPKLHMVKLHILCVPFVWGLQDIKEYENSVVKQNKKNYLTLGTWLAQSVAYVTLHLSVMSLSPTLGIELILKKYKFEKILSLFNSALPHLIVESFSWGIIIHSLWKTVWEILI